MLVRLHPHARERIAERGASIDEVVATISQGESISARFSRSSFRRNFSFAGTWRGRVYATKQVEVYAVEENGAWLVITVIVRYF
jgi:uncharacterized protein DUF4258